MHNLAQFGGVSMQNPMVIHQNVSKPAYRNSAPHFPFWIHFHIFCYLLHFYSTSVSFFNLYSTCALHLFSFFCFSISYFLSYPTESSYLIFCLIIIPLQHNMYYQGSNPMMDMNSPSQGQGQGQGPGQGQNQGQGQGQGGNGMYDPNQHIQHPLGPGQGMSVRMKCTCVFVLF